MRSAPRAVRPARRRPRPVQSPLPSRCRSLLPRRRGIRAQPCRPHFGSGRCLWGIDAAIVLTAFALADAIHELLGVVVLVAGTAAYYVLMIKGQWRGTVGHHVVGLSVLDNESREPIEPRTAGLRLAINAVLAIPFGLGLLLNVPMVDRSAGRTVHDVGSGTIVVRAR